MAGVDSWAVEGDAAERSALAKMSASPTLAKAIDRIRTLSFHEDDQTMPRGMPHPALPRRAAHRVSDRFDLPIRGRGRRVRWAQTASHRLDRCFGTGMNAKLVKDVRDMRVDGA